VVPEFLYYLFSSPSKQREIVDGSIGSSIPGFNLARLKTLTVLLPPIAEQRCIARAISEAEGVESRIQELISKKRSIFEGIALRLLSGQTRLTSSSGDWKQVVLGDYVEGSRGAGLSKDVLSVDGEYPCILYGELFTTYGRLIGKVRSRASVASSVQSQAGDVLVPGSTTTVARDLATASALHTSNVYIGGDTNILRPRGEIDSNWLAYCITHALGGQIAEIAQGTTIKHLYVRDLLRCSVRVPEMAEQKLIASALEDVQREISLLGLRLRKARAIKDGLMQELLTGRIRLPVPGDAA
jgi:type I restriction enzyme S subunit